jgi:hypothetical protein
MKSIRNFFLKRTMDRHRSFLLLFRKGLGENCLKPEAMEFFKHLRDFCLVDRPASGINPKTGDISTNALLVAEGRREVYFEIMRVLNMSDKEIQKIREEIRLEEEKENDYVRRDHESSFLPSGD